jgi:hypothetical protein
VYVSTDEVRFPKAVKPPEGRIVRGAYEETTRIADGGEPDGELRGGLTLSVYEMDSLERVAMRAIGASLVSPR